MRCPRCHALLRPVQQQTQRGRIEIDYCPSCRGIYFDSGELEALLQLDGDAALVGGRALFVRPPGGLATPPPIPCPRHPHIAMNELLMTGAEGPLLHAVRGDRGRPELRIDRCPRCAGIWLDGGELAALTEVVHAAPIHPLWAPVPSPAEGVERAATPWLWLFMFLTGLPVETWQTRARRPLVVLLLLIVCCAVYAMQAVLGDDSLTRLFGLYPARLWRGDYLPLVTHMFLHGSIVHLLGNLYFLWVFGDNVEDRLGSGRFLFLYLISGLGAALLHCLLSSDPTVPVVGASGAIAGVLAAYALLFPQARLVSLIFVFQVRWKTSTYLLMWLVLQFVGALWSREHVAWWAHIGGFLVGAALVWSRRGGQGKGLPSVAAWPPVGAGAPAAIAEPPPRYWQ
jgi:membrane associated rhomboid family serine protease/Zn-finger nucleic acid-binding protein